MDDAFYFVCSTKLLEALREAADQRGRSMSSLIREAVRKEIAQQRLPLESEQSG